MNKTAWIGGGAGFIGHHLARRLAAEGYKVRVVDLHYPEYGMIAENVQYHIADLRDPLQVRRTLVDRYQEPFYKPKCFDEYYQLAADMGGAGFVFTGEHDADIMHNSALINLNVLDGLRQLEFKGKVFYSSSACMYPQELQTNVKDSKGNLWFGALSEKDAYPANPDSEYGWEKLFSERLYLSYARNYDIDVRIARFHNIYGPEGTYKGGREKAPAAMCRKAIEATDSLEIWGTGEQTRSFLYIDDCIDAVRLLMQSYFREPINIGSEEMISINDLAMIAISLSKKYITIEHVDGPIGVMGRNSDNTLIRKVLSWEPKYTLLEGMNKTFKWIQSVI